MDYLHRQDACVVVGLCRLQAEPDQALVIAGLSSRLAVAARRPDGGSGHPPEHDRRGQAVTRLWLNRLYSSPCARAQLIAGPTLLAEGRLQGFIGANTLTAITDLLGATTNAGTFIAGLLVLVPDTRRSTARTSCRARVGAHSHAARAGSGRPRAGRRAHR